MQRIAGVDSGTIAEELGVVKGDSLVSINGQPVLDIVDYEYLCAEERLVLLFVLENGEEYEADVEKDLYEPLGLSFESGLMSPVRSCKNHCIFCFIDQMPKGGRETLQFKDDDWRMSFIMGKLYHADQCGRGRVSAYTGPSRQPTVYLRTRHRSSGARKYDAQPECRIAYEKTRKAVRCAVCDFIARSYAVRVSMTAKCCKRHWRDVASLRPAAQSVAVVPVGLTKFRQELAPLRVFTKEEARSTLLHIQEFSKKCKQQTGSAFVFVADELILLAEGRTGLLMKHMRIFRR